MKIVFYKNNVHRLKFFQAFLYPGCLVFMFHRFDVALWWGDSYADMDYNGKV